MKRLGKIGVSLALALMMILSMMSFASAQEDVVLTWAVQASTKEIGVMEKFQKLVEEKLDGIKLELIQIPMQDWPDYYQKITAMAAAGQCPDLGRAAERLLPGLITNELLYDITDYVAEMDTSKYYMDAMVGNNVRDGRYYGLPSGIYTTLMYFNMDLFDAAGIPYPSTDWENPMTMQECSDASIALTKGEGADKVFGFSYRSSFANPAYWCMISSCNGGGYFYDEDGTTPKINTPSHIAALEWYKKMNDVGAVTLPTDIAILSTAAMFGSGKLAMTLEGTWSMAQMIETSDFEVGIAPAPGDVKSASNSFLDCFVMFSQTKYPEECWEVLKLLYSEEGWAIIDGAYGSPLLRSAFETYLETKVRPFVKDESYVQAVVDSFSYLESIPYSDYWEEATVQCTALKDEWLLGNMTSEELANRCQEIMLRMKAKYEK